IENTVSPRSPCSHKPNLLTFQGSGLIGALRRGFRPRARKSQIDRCFWILIQAFPVVEDFFPDEC
ncbi:MAG: hypothetical protein MUC60_15795, partial [Oscillatoria sp. Prado101]|nr:hypothetical protein [Oscillatoria sp. Prado101]